MLNVNELLREIEQLPASDKWQLIKSMLELLEHEQNMPEVPSNWHEALRQTYGILADDPIERSSQLPIEDRELIE